MRKRCFYVLLSLFLLSSSGCFAENSAIRHKIMMFNGLAAKYGLSIDESVEIGENFRITQGDLTYTFMDGGTAAAIQTSEDEGIGDLLAAATCMIFVYGGDLTVDSYASLAMNYLFARAGQETVPYASGDLSYGISMPSEGSYTFIVFKRGD